jgi:hypothetical protein
MSLPENTASWFKLLGNIFAGSGSLLLAWRARLILKWVVNALVVHEGSISQLRRVLDGEPQSGAVVEGVTTHLLRFEKEPGAVLLVLGLSLLGIGMLCQAGSLLFGAT